MHGSARWIGCVLVGAALAAVPAAARGGTIYTDRAAFEAAVGGAAPTLEEDFEGFAEGDVTEVFLAAAGALEITAVDLRPGMSVAITVTGPIAGGSPPSLGYAFLSLDTGGLFLTAPDFEPLGLAAFGLDYGPFTSGSEWLFSSTLALDTFAVPGDGEFLDLNRFIGWVGAPGELLVAAGFQTPGSGSDQPGGVLDNIAGYEALGDDSPLIPAPEPGTGALFALGLVGLAAARRRRKWQASDVRVEPATLEVCPERVGM